MGDVTTGGSSTKPNSELVSKTSDMLLGGLQKAYKGGVDVFNKPLYTSPSGTTQQAWGQGAGFANDLIGSNGFGAGQKSAMDKFTGLGSQYAGLGNAYDPNSAAYKTLRQGVVDDTLSNLGSQFTASGRFGGGSYVDTASQGLGDALAGLDYNNMQNNINNRYRSLDSQAGISSGAFGMGQQALGNRQGAIGLLGQVGASQDANSLAKRMANADLFDRTKNADWNTLGRATSILGGNATAGGSTTSNSVPWWAALLGGAATGASIFG